MKKDPRPTPARQLGAKSDALAASLRDILTRLPFQFDDGSGPSDVHAIRFEYAFDTFDSTAFPIHRARGCCGKGFALHAIEPVFETAAEKHYLASLPAAKRDAAGDKLDEAKKTAFRRWFMKGWRTTRAAAPAVRGFFSVHDTIWVTDLDTGKEMTEKETGFCFYD